MTAALIGYGAWLRIQRLAEPPRLFWDEHHFVENARNYLAGKPDWNDHPPLGKLLIAVPMHVLGDDSFAWRLAPLLAGLAIVIYLGLLVHWATQDKAAALLAAAIVSVDGFFICYSRTALLDGMLAACCLAAITTALRAKTSVGLAVASALLGSACNIKFSAVVFVPALIAIVLSSRGGWSRLVVPWLAPIAYFAWYSLGLWLTHQECGPGAVVDATTRLLAHHAQLTEWKHPLCSHWYTWFLPTRPVTLRDDPTSDGRLEVLSSMGNPVVWWWVDAVLLVALGLALRRGLRALRRGRADARARWEDFRRTPFARQLLIAALWSLPIAPWIFSRRDSYIYHYLLAYVFGVALLGSVLGALYRKRPLAALLGLTLIGVVGVYFAPVWGELPITQRGFEQRLFVPSWR